MLFSTTIAVITINLNNRSGLQKTMESVLVQTRQPDEYLVIDGGSTDGSAEYMAAFQNRLSFAQSKPDKGIYDAMNTGLQQATADYLLFLNSGDVFTGKDALATLAAKARWPFDVVYGDLIYFGENGEPIEKKYPNRLPRHYFNYDSLPHPASLIRRKALLKTGGYDTRFKIVSDWKWFRALYKRKPYAFYHVPSFISVFQTDGMSSRQENRELLQNERDQVLNQYG